MTSTYRETELIDDRSDGVQYRWIWMMLDHKSGEIVIADRAKSLIDLLAVHCDYMPWSPLEAIAVERHEPARDVDRRTLAFITNAGELPVYFINKWGTLIGPVPRRFREECRRMLPRYLGIKEPLRDDRPTTNGGQR